MAPRFSKQLRQQIHAKYGGHCAYCGKVVEYHDMQVDHIHPQYRGGLHDIENLNPSCRMCNFRKGTLTVEHFRQELQDQADGVCKTFQGRMSLAYGLIERHNKPVTFYFEKLTKNQRYEQN